MRHSDDQEGDEEGSAKEGSGEAGSRMEMGCHGAGGGEKFFNAEMGSSCCCH